MPPLADPFAEAKRIIEAAAAKKITLKLFGGMSFFFRCPSASHRTLQRKYVDIDFMGHSKQSKQIRQLFEGLGYVGRSIFNSMQGHKRLIFNDMENQRRVDIFLDLFEMCHKFDFTDRLDVGKDGMDAYTIPLADMLATKLQIIEMNEKDIKDILSVFVDYDVGGSDSNMINGAYLAKMCGNDWGIYKTFTMNLDRILESLPQRDLESGQKETVKTRIERLRTMIEDQPKSLGWKMRARVGERAPWYDLPEADKEVVDSRSVDSKANATVSNASSTE